MAMGFQLPSMQNAFWNTTRVKDDNQNTRGQLADKEGKTWCLWSIYFPKEMLLNTHITSNSPESIWET